MYGIKLSMTFIIPSLWISVQAPQKLGNFALIDDSFAVILSFVSAFNIIMATCLLLDLELPKIHNDFRDRTRLPSGGQMLKCFQFRFLHRTELDTLEVFKIC